MRKLQITLFILGFAALGSQTLRHIYVKWLEPRTSVLEKYQEKVEADISKSKSLQELLALYDQAHKDVQEFEKAHPVAPGEYRSSVKEPYNTEAKLQRAIQDVEERRKQIREVVFFFIAGTALALVGLFAFRRNAWMGMALIILGFAEIIWWTSPSFRNFGAQVEFERLLTIKLLLSVVSLIGLVALWKLSDEREPSAPRN
jgi:hypothetical protein